MRRSYRYSHKLNRFGLSRRQWATLTVLAIVWLAGSLHGESKSMAAGVTTAAPQAIITCSNPYVIDGDTIDCAQTRIRLTGIDAPEMPGHCNRGRKCTAGDPHAAKNHLVSLVQGSVSCTSMARDKYGRTIARCTTIDNTDISCEMVRSGHAVERYGQACI